MTLDKKIDLIAKALDTAAQLAPATPLASIEEWDSVGTIAVIVMLDKHFKVTLEANQIAELKTVQDILNFMADKE